MTADECLNLGYPVAHKFNHDVDAPRELMVTCTAGKRPDGLPDWVWSAEGYEFLNLMPSCVDPTFCDTDPPVPYYDTTTRYQVPPLGSFKYNDGEVVTYTCIDPSE